MKRSLVGTGGLIIALAGCGPTAAVRPGATTPPPTSTAQPTATPVPAAPSVLVFAKYSGGRVASSAVTTWRRLDGTAINTVTSTNSDSTFDMSVSNNSGYIGYSQEVLASNELYNAAGSVSVTKWAILGKDGVSRPVAPSLTPFLNQSWQTTGDTRILPGIFIDGAGTLFAAESSASGTVKYDRVNVTTGEITTLFTAAAISSAGFFTFLPENISPSGDEISFLVANATVANQTVAGLAVATFAPQTGAVVVHDLPSSTAHAFFPPPGATGWEPTAFASADGNFIVYQSAAVTNGTQTLAIHVYQVDRGQDLTIAAASGVSFSGGANSVFFSPDNTYAALLNGGGSAGGIVVVATSTGAVIKSVPISDTSTQDIALMGWTSTKALVYVTNTAGTPGSFDPENGVAHWFDPASGSIHDYAAGLGELIAVLY